MGWGGGQKGEEFSVRKQDQGNEGGLETRGGRMKQWDVHGHGKAKRQLDQSFAVEATLQLSYYRVTFFRG